MREFIFFVRLMGGEEGEVMGGFGDDQVDGRLLDLGMESLVEDFDDDFEFDIGYMEEVVVFLLVQEWFCRVIIKNQGLGFYKKLQQGKYFY